MIMIIIILMILLRQLVVTLVTPCVITPACPPWIYAPLRIQAAPLCVSTPAWTPLHAHICVSPVAASGTAV